MNICLFYFFAIVKSSVTMCHRRVALVLCRAVDERLDQVQTLMWQKSIRRQSRFRSIVI